MCLQQYTQSLHQKVRHDNLLRMSLSLAAHHVQLYKDERRLTWCTSENQVNTYSYGKVKFIAGCDVTMNTVIIVIKIQNHMKNRLNAKYHTSLYIRRYFNGKEELR